MTFEREEGVGNLLIHTGNFPNEKERFLISLSLFMEVGFDGKWKMETEEQVKRAGPIIH